MTPITTEWLETIGFYQDADRPLAWLLWLPDDARPNVQSYLQLIASTYRHGRVWTAELVNVVEGEWIAAAVPRPITTQGNVLFLITAVGGCVLNPYELQIA
jgi:hypothetical protein